MMYEISKEVPVPKTHHLKKYPFADMSVNDSFPVSVEEKFNASHAGYQFGKRYGKKFSTRQHDGAYRCWRTE